MLEVLSRQWGWTAIRIAIPALPRPWRCERVSAVNVRDRVNLVNSRLRSAAGERSLFIDLRCKELIKDLERVCWREDETGQATSELDKSDRMRTHVSDALGYYVARRFWSGDRRVSAGRG